MNSMNATLRVSGLSIFFFCAATTFLLGDQPPEQPGQEETASGSTETLLLGKWKGLGPCDGSLVVRKDGTFSQYSVGPTGENWNGKWKLTWSTLPPVLELQITSYEPEDELNETNEFKVTKLDEGKLTLTLKEKYVVQYKRVSKETPKNKKGQQK
jgi:hypothetical protein